MLRSDPRWYRRPSAALLVAAVLAIGSAATAGEASAGTADRNGTPSGAVTAVEQRTAELSLRADPATAQMMMTGIVGGPDAVLTPTLFARAAIRRMQLTPAQRLRLDDLLELPQQPLGRAYLLKALAAGHTVDEVGDLAAQIQDRDPEWLRSHLSLLEPLGRGPAEYDGFRIAQADATTCGSTAIVVARAMSDPIYAFALTTGGQPDGAAVSGEAFAARLKATEEQVHRDTNGLWPRAAGTPPWGVTGQLNRYAGSTGTVYRWRILLAGVSDAVQARALADALTALDQGFPVPLLTGDLIPRHYVLLIRHDADGVLVYQPSGGVVVRVADPDFLRGDLGRALGFPRIRGVIAPDPAHA